MAQSTPRSAGIRVDRLHRVDLAGVERLVGAHVRGHSRRCATGSTAQMRPAPAACRQAIVSSPMGPAPNTATVSPSCMAANLMECSGHCERLDGGGHLQRMLFRDGEQVGRRQVHELAEEPGIARDC